MSEFTVGMYLKMKNENVFHLEQKEIRRQCLMTNTCGFPLEE